MDAPLAADRVDRDDPLVLHMGRGEGLGLEPTEAAGVDGRGEREDLQRDPTPQRDLLGLVDDPHPAPPDLAEEPEVAQLAEARGGLLRRPAGLAPPACAKGCRESRHLVVAVEEFLQFGPKVGVRPRNASRSGACPSSSASTYSRGGPG